MKPYYDNERDAELQFSPDGSNDPWGRDMQRRRSSTSGQGGIGGSMTKVKIALGFILLVGLLVLLFKPDSIPDLVSILT